MISALLGVLDIVASRLGCVVVHAGKGREEGSEETGYGVGKVERDVNRYHEWDQPGFRRLLTTDQGLDARNQ